MSDFIERKNHFKRLQAYYNQREGIINKLLYNHASFQADRYTRLSDFQTAKEIVENKLPPSSAFSYSRDTAKRRFKGADQIAFRFLGITAISAFTEVFARRGVSSFNEGLLKTVLVAIPGIISTTFAMLNFKEGLEFETIVEAQSPRTR